MIGKDHSLLSTCESIISRQGCVPRGTVGTFSGADADPNLWCILGAPKAGQIVSCFIRPPYEHPMESYGILHECLDDWPEMAILEWADLQIFLRSPFVVKLI